MKQLKTKLFLFSLGFSLVLFSACTKSSNKPDLPFQQYTLYNYSQGSPVEAGRFTIQQQADSTAALTIQLNTGYYLPGITMPAAIVTTDLDSGTDLMYANLNPVDGNNGLSVTNPVKGTNNLSISYSVLISKKGYRVRILSGNNVQAVGTIE